MRRLVTCGFLVACGGASPERAPDAASPDAEITVDAPVEVSPITRCGVPVPSGVTEAPAPPIYAGSCPQLAAAPGITTIQSGGTSREFMVVAPQTIAPGEKLPVVFVWHWLGGEASDVYGRLQLQQAADTHRLIAIAPEDKGDILFKWPFGVSQSDERLAEELQFFDDMLACVAAAYPIDKNCVSTMGISAGALMTDQLASRRSDRIASFVSLSGGVGGLARDWMPAQHKLPALVLWGGPEDMYPDNTPLAHFDSLSNKLETGLAADGHVILECVHNCGHSLPPFDDAPAFELLWRFVLDHPFWLPAGKSIYQQGLPSAAPAWCALGKGAAMPRTDPTCP